MPFCPNILSAVASHLTGKAHPSEVRLEVCIRAVIRPLWFATRRNLATTAVLGATLLPFSASAQQQSPPPEAPVVQAPKPTPIDPSSVPNYPTAQPSASPPVTAPPLRPYTEADKPVVEDEPTKEHPNVARNPYNPDLIPSQFSDYWLGSTYIDMDSWVYPALLRLYSRGYIDTAFLSLRPWTRRSVLHMLEKSEGAIRDGGDTESEEILDKVLYELRDEPSADGLTKRGLITGVSSAYVSVRGVGGTVLRDSWHLGQTFINDYGRPYSSGFNTYDGGSVITELGPFSLRVRGEYQHAPGYEGYSYALASTLSNLDGISYNNPSQDYFGGTNRPQATIPEGPVSSVNRFHLIEATFAAHVFNHEVSIGKSDAWLGPGLGGAMQWSNNADNIYAFRINRVEPLHIPLVSKLLGDTRYDFFVGSLKGHTYPNSPWAHSEKIDFAPTKNFQFGFQRTIIWGGKNHAPITLHTFFKGFFDFNDTTQQEKYSRDDPGARFSSVTFSYRLPFLRKLATLYADSTTHDDLFPLSAPRRAGWLSGIYLTRLPYAPKLDLRVEGVYTDFVTSTSTKGQGNYYETIQRQGMTNSGVIFGDWIGREAKGGQAWLTYHLSGNEWVSLQYLRKKNGNDFPAGGTTQNTFRVDLVKRLTRDVELNAWFQEERWKAPIWKTGQQGSTTAAFTLTWYPDLKTPQ